MQPYDELIDGWIKDALINVSMEQINIDMREMRESLMKLIVTGDELNFQFRKQELESYYEARRNLCPSDE